MSYYELAETVRGERQLLARDLAVNLDAISNRLAELDPADEELKEYAALMRLFLAAQKQFEKLLPSTDAIPEADALTEFNKSVYDKHGILTI